MNLGLVWARSTRSIILRRQPIPTQRGKTCRSLFEEGCNNRVWSARPMSIMRRPWWLQETMLQKILPVPWFNVRSSFSKTGSSVTIFTRHGSLWMITFFLLCLIYEFAFILLANLGFSRWRRKHAKLRVWPQKNQTKKQKLQPQHVTDRFPWFGGWRDGCFWSGSPPNNNFSLCVPIARWWTSILQAAQLSNETCRYFCLTCISVEF